MRHRRTPALVALVALVAVVSSALVVGCGRSGPVERRLLIVGLDGLEWSVVEPLIEQGRMPNLAALMERGVSAPLESLVPRQKSPVIWTTMATGKLPEKHNITTDVDPSTKRILTSNVRTARTVWDILGDEEVTVSVIGWLVSWPAEPLRGSMVTDYFRYPPNPDRAPVEHLTYPEELVDEIEPLRVVADDLADEDVERFYALDRAMTEREAQGLSVDRMFTEMRAINELDQRIWSLKDLHAADRTFMGVSKHLIRNRPTDVFAVYLRGTDSVSHRFWAAAFPEETGVDISETDVRVFGETVERYYEFADEALGELIDAFGDDATVIVCSDHGFEGPRPDRPAGGINDHGPIGVLVMAGEGVREGAQIETASVRDITPTVLGLYGLPVADDMDGRVLTEAFDEDFASRHPVRSIPTYEVEE